MHRWRFIRHNVLSILPPPSRYPAIRRCASHTPQFPNNDYINDLKAEYTKPLLNLNEFLIERHHQDSTAFLLDKNGKVEEFTYADLDAYANHLASILQQTGVQTGSRVAVLLPKSFEVVVTALAVWRLGATYVPLFTAFGSEAIHVRIKDAAITVMITDELNRPKLNHLSSLAGVNIMTVFSSSNTSREAFGSDVPFPTQLELQHARESVSLRPQCAAAVAPEDPIVMLYTSGTTGIPKGVLVPAFALASFQVYMELGLGLQCDVGSYVSSRPPFVCTTNQRYLSMADPAWAYGLYYNLIGPLLIGVPFTYLAGGFTAQRALRALREHRITHFAAAPSAYRALRAYKPDNDDDLAEIWEELKHHLVACSSAGEPLNPEINEWFSGCMGGRVIGDHFGQSEVGMVCNWHWGDALVDSTLLDTPKPLPWTLPGSMGRSMNGIRCVVLGSEDSPDSESKTLNTSSLTELDTNIVGNLAIDTHNSPLMWFRGYWNNPTKTSACTSPCGRYYLTGDSAYRTTRISPVTKESEDIFWYSSRNDDIIKTSGYRIGPFEVESCLLGDERVVEVAVTGIPDPQDLRGEIIAAFIVLCPTASPSESLSSLLQEIVSKRLGKHCFPRKIYFVDSLPKTPSGKIQRYLLREQVKSGVL